MLSLYTLVILAVAHVNALPINTPLTTPATCTWCTSSSSTSSSPLTVPSLATGSAPSIAASVSIPAVTTAASVNASTPAAVVGPVVANLASTVSSVTAAANAKVDSAVATSGQVVSSLLSTADSINATLKAKVDPVVNIATDAHVGSLASASGSVSVDPTSQISSLVNLLSLCRTLSVSLNDLVGKIGSTTSLVGSLVNSNVASAVTGLNGFVEVSANSIKTIGAVTDAQLQAVLYAAYKLMADSVIQSCNSVVSQKTYLMTQKAALHAALMQLQASVHAMTDALFGACIPTGLDVNNIRAALYVSLQAAIDATA